MTKSAELMKLNAAIAALKFIPENKIIGVGTGTTVNYFIEQLATIRNKISATVASSIASENLLKEYNIPVIDLNSAESIEVYVDGADAYNEAKQLIKGGGGALTREKIIAAASNKFVCIVDATKKPGVLGTKFPVPVEVIPMARSYVSREIVKLGGQPSYRDGFITDNGNTIIDVHGWEITQPIDLETKINQITGVVCNGIFAIRPADEIIIGNT